MIHQTSIASSVSEDALKLKEHVFASTGGITKEWDLRQALLITEHMQAELAALKAKLVLEQKK